MAYLRPDVYVEREAKGAEPVQNLGTSVTGFVGVAERGVVGEATLVTSWTDYVTKFARGLATPFMSNSDLAYAVYGFFQNGGGRAYVTRIASDAVAKATATIPETSGAVFTAKEGGSWGNNIGVTVAGSDTAYVITITYDGEEVEEFDVSTTTTDSNYYVTYINDNSNYVTVESGTLGTSTEELLETGADGIDDLSDSDYTSSNGLESFNGVDDLNLVVIPGQTTEAVLQGALDYCAGRKDCFAILDIPMGQDASTALTTKEAISGSYGAIYYPWGKVIDPIGNGKLRLVPPSGHIAGIYARTDRERGVHKAPAGLEAQVRGFVELERRITDGEIETLNPKGVNCIVAKTNRGIVVWGAKMVTAHLDRTYVSDIRLDIHIETSLYQGTQWTIFEPNDEKLWGRIIAQVKAFLYTKWTEGGLLGATSEEAFFVKCDEELNPEEVRNAGRVIVEVGYAKKKPAEFTIFRLTQKTANGS